jgi:uncharacterized surface protein with fasciclin (FAS1) repeats
LQVVFSTEMLETLSGAGPFTLFAADNTAFHKNCLSPLWADATALKLGLQEMIVPALVRTQEVAEGETTFKTLGGEGLVLTRRGGDFTVRGEFGGPSAAVVQMDIPASNGVVHVIDTFL